MGSSTIASNQHEVTPSMKIDSVRDLKAMLIQTVIDPMNTAGSASKSFTLPAGPIDQMGGVLPSFALGVAKRTNTDFRLAVRYQRRELAYSKELEAITKRAKEEVDVRYIGRIEKGADIPWTRRRHRPLK